MTRWALSLLIFLTLLLSAAADCSQRSCGEVQVSFPFGLSELGDCPAFSPFFNLTCDRSTNHLFLDNVATLVDTSLNTTSVNNTNRLLITNITNTSLIVDITSLNASLPPLFPSPSNGSCSTGSFIRARLRLPPFPGPFYISEENELGSFGCTYALLVTAKVFPFESSPAPLSPPLSSPSPSPLPSSPEQQIGSSAETPAPTADGGGGAPFDYAGIAVDGCAVMCPGDEVNALQCGSGRVCCATSMANGSGSRYARYNVFQSPFAENLSCQGGTNYATLFHRNSSDLNRGIYRLKLMWALPSNFTNNLPRIPNYACSKDANSSIVEGVPGYLCYCSSGYKGDGYLKGLGCDDIDECGDPEYGNDCVSTSTCQNSPPGSYTCRCKNWFHSGDGRSDGSGCQFSPKLRLGLLIGGALLMVGLMMGVSFCLAIWWRRKTKEMYFKQHGGLELQDILRSRSGGDTRIFKEEELKAATDNYADHMKLGAGGFGTVFKGVLEDGTVVAIKKAHMKKGDESDREQFLNEMAILVRINHRHIVRLLGCCLETVVPLLVYEFVSNGNLEQNLEGSSGTAALSWLQRLKVAHQTAEALAYLHGAASPPILHRDVKSANVLLDDSFDAKVADFGLSLLVVDGVEEAATALQGTIGYLDPEYIQTLELTDKSDVYSLGVVLVELMTGLKAVDSHNRQPNFVSLALLFISHMNESKFEELVDARLTHNLANHDTHSSIVAVAALARRCLELEGSRRPSMSQVVDKLRHVLQLLKFGEKEEEDENAPLLLSKGDSSKMDESMEATAMMPDDSGSHFNGLQISGSMHELLVKATTMPR